MARKPTTGRGKPKAEKQVTRYTYGEIKEPRTPETGHTPLLAAEEPMPLPQRNAIVSESRFAECFDAREQETATP